MSLSPRISLATGRGTWYLKPQPVIAIIAAVLLALVIVYVPAPYGWILVVGGAVVAITLVEPLAGLYLLPFAVAFGSLFTVAVHGLNAGLTDLLVAALAISTLWHAWWRPSESSAHQPAEKLDLAPSALSRRLAAVAKREPLLALTLGAFLLYLLVVILSLSVALSKSLALKEVIKWTEVLVLLTLAVTLIRNVRIIHGIAWSIIGAGVCEALLGYWQWIQVTGSHSATATSLRVFGTFGQPNPFAGYLNFALLLSVALLLFSNRTPERWLAAAAAAIILFASYLADSRGAELGLAVALLALVIVAWHRERLAGIALLIGVPVLAMAWFIGIVPAHLRQDLLSQVTLGPVNSANFSVQERLAHWVAGLRMFRTHPILGVGAGNYSAAYARYQVSPDWFEALGHAHNYYINAAAETGAIGLLAFLALVGVSLFAGWWAIRTQARALYTSPNTPSGSDARLGWALALGFFAALVAFNVHNLTDDLFVHAMELQFALAVACLLRLLMSGKETWSTKDSASL
ncbi:MAG: O-antigen ligase family protein [Ktedonobacterales bacterium]